VRLLCWLGLHVKCIRIENPADRIPQPDFESVMRWLGTEWMVVECARCGKVLERRALD
jgi:hypothetical protein